MKFIVQCPKCAWKIHLDADYADKRKRCPHCLRLFKVPSIDELNTAVKVIKNANSTIFVDEEGNIYG